MTEFLPWIVSSVGFVGATYFFFGARWLGWIGIPMVLLFIRYTVDSGLAPLITKEMGIRYLTGDASVIFPATPSDVPLAITTLTLGYGSILFGMLVVRFFGSFNRVKAAAIPLTEEQQHNLDMHYFKGSMLLFFIGCFINGIIIVYAGMGISFSEIASTRALFTNESAYGSVIFNYARLFRTSMLFGALGMLIFSYRLNRNKMFSILAVLSYIAIQPIFGGRTVLIVSVLYAIFIFHYAIRKVRIRDAIIWLVILYIGLLYIASLRHGHVGGGAAAQTLLQFLVNRCVDEVAFAINNFPAKADFLGGSTIVAGLTHLIPGLKYDAVGLWRTLQDLFLPSYIIKHQQGGQTLSTTAESFINFGYTGVIWLGILYGVFFGGIYEWQRKNPGNPFIILIVAGVTLTVFFIGIYKKMPTRISDFPMTILLPVAAIVVLSFSIKRNPMFIFLILITVILLVGYKAFGLLVFKYLMFASIIALYILCFKLINNAFKYSDK
jgi:oligosaccharide repeat unit polymerase